MSTCQHCSRTIVQDSDGTWVDPQATGDDYVWAETCDANDTFVADHEPAPVKFDVDFIMALEGEDESLTQHDVISAFQDGIDTGMVWGLQGAYGRMAQSLIDQGLCTDPVES